MPLAGAHLIYFGPGQWDGLWRNRHHLLSRFARHNQVLYVEPAIHLKTFRRAWWEGRLGWQRLWRESRQSRISQAGPNLYIYHSPTFAPVAGRFPLDRLTSFLWLAALKTELRRLKFTDPIVWFSRPEMVSLMGHLPARLTIYHVVDEYTAYEGVSVELACKLRRQEKELLTRAGMVVVVSPALWQAKQSCNPRTYLVPNGTDLEAFAQAARGSGPPTDLAEIPEPRLIYAGLVGNRLDLPMLIALAKRRPDWSVVVIGEVDARGCEAEIASLRALPNAHLLGLRPVTAVPRYLLASQVCLLPYRRCAETDHIDPLKLYDGLAAGKPIVASPIPAVRPYDGLVRLAYGVEAFEVAVEAALGEQDESLVAARRAVAAANTWETRVQQLSRLIEARLNGAVTG
jgi:glycosyltransferase involved in cell wall biosynthesis